MSKYGYFGGSKRTVDSSLKGDPEGPSLEELQRFFKQEALKDRKIADKLDPRLGGPARHSGDKSSHPQELGSIETQSCIETCL